MADVCVLGAGPAGCVFAARMAELGHRVSLVERLPFPRHRLGESLTPGVAPLLRAAGFGPSVESGVVRVRTVRVAWPDLQLREDRREEGMLVERGAFDKRLLDRTQAFGVRVLQPAHIVERRQRDSGWRLKLQVDGRTMELDADFLADATGRGGEGTRANAERTGPPTLALYAYWRGRRLPNIPTIEAGREAWCWGVPLPDGRYNTLAFVDPRAFRRLEGASLLERFQGLLRASNLMRGCDGAEPCGPIAAIDATPYTTSDSVTRLGIRIGDAALAIDPISSSGVQKAVQSALAGAIVANTILKKPERVEQALDFYRTTLREASDRHRFWAAQHYSVAAAKFEGPFWAERSAPAGAPAPLSQARPSVDGDFMAASLVGLSNEVEFVRLPCLDEQFVFMADAIRAPGLEGPVAFLAGQSLAPLLRELPKASTPLQLACSWTDRMPLKSGLAIAAWLVHHGVLVQQSRAEAPPR